jgi:hypothetical protein
MVQRQRARVNELVTSLLHSEDVANIDMEIDMQTIQNKLRRFETLIDPQYRTKREFLINPDGLEAANYIDNFQKHMGYIIAIAFEHIEDEAIHERITRHGYAALKGVK